MSVSNLSTALFQNTTVLGVRVKRIECGIPTRKSDLGTAIERWCKGLLKDLKMPVAPEYVKGSIARLRRQATYTLEDLE